MTALSAFRFDSQAHLPPAEPDLVSIAADEGSAALDAFMRDVGGQIGADGMLVTWHVGSNPPARLFSDGVSHPGSGFERELSAAASTAHVHDDSPAIHWAPPAETNGVQAILTIRLPVSGATMMVVLLFLRGAPDPHVAARAAAIRLLPAMRAFASIWWLHAAAQTRARGLSAVLESSDVATLLIDRHGRILLANPAAETMLAERDGLRRSGTMLAGTRLADTMRLQAAIEHVTGGGYQTLTDATPVIALQRGERRPLLAAVVSAGPAPGADEVAALVHLFDPDHDLRRRLAPVCKLYALSPTETRLATLLAGGAALMAASAQMKIQEQTARSYLKQIFAKTGTNRQAELVWLMLASAVRTSSRHYPALF